MSATSVAESDDYFNLVTLLLPGTGTNGAQNNTFLDSSTNNFAVTRNGSATQGTFSPFSQTGWSNYFDGSGDYISAPDNAALEFGSGDFTIEAWIYLTAYSASYSGFYSAFIVARDTSGARSYNFAVTATASSFTGLSFYNFDGSGNANLAFSASATINLNTWYHVAVSRSSTTFRLFLNGTLIGTTTSAVSVLDTATPTRIGSGAYSGFEYYTAGYISNVRIVKGTAVYTAAFTPSTSPLTAISGTSLLTCQSNRFVDNSTNAFAITVSGNTSVQSFAPFDPTTAYASATNGGSGFFTGTSSTGYLSLTQAASNAIFPSGGTGGFTIEFWFFPAATSSTFNSVVAGAWTGTVGQVWWEINCGSTGFNITLGNNGFGSSSGNIQSSTPFIANQWTHVVLQRRSNGTSWDVYQNGVNVSANQTSPNNFNLYSVAPIRIAYGYGNTVLSSLTAFYLANFRITNSQVYSSNFTPPTEPLPPISGTSLLLNYTNGGIIDATAKNALETVGNASISTAQSKWGGSSMLFDKTDDRLTIPSSQNYNFGTGNFTIEFWMYSNDVSGATTRGILQTSDTAGGLKTTYTSGLCIFQGSTATGSAQNGALVANIIGTSVGTNAGGIITAGAWYHIAVVRSSGVCTVYVNGTAQPVTATISGAISGQNLVVGGYYNTSYLYDGYIDDLRITKGYARYAANFTPPTQAFPTL